MSKLKTGAVAALLATSVGVAARALKD